MPSQYSYFQPKAGKKGNAANTVPKGSFNVSPEHSSEGADSRVRRIKKESDAYVKSQRSDPNAPHHRLFGGTGPRPAPAPSDPNNTGSTGTQMSINPGKPIANMTYESFMQDIGDKYGLQFPKPALSSANLPGTPGYGQSFMLNGKPTPITEMSAEDRFALDHTAGRTSQYMKGFKGDPSDPQAMMAWAINHGYTGTADIPGQKAEQMGQKGDQMDQNRQLQAGLGDSVAQKDSEQTRGTYINTFGDSDDDRFNNFDNDYGDLSHLTSDMRADSRAFLDTPDTAIGLRRAEAARNIIYQGQKHYKVDPNAEGGLTQISRGAARETAETQDLDAAITNNPLATAENAAANVEARAAAKNKSAAVSKKGASSIGEEAANFNPANLPSGNSDMLNEGANAIGMAAAPSNSQNPVTIGEDGVPEVIDNAAAMKVAGFAQDFANKAITRTKEQLFR